jgi:hypothetical protein
MPKIPTPARGDDTTRVVTFWPALLSVELCDSFEHIKWLVQHVC